MCFRHVYVKYVSTVYNNTKTKLKEFLSACLGKKRVLNTMLMTQTHINNWFIYIRDTCISYCACIFMFFFFYLIVRRNKKEVIRENGTPLYPRIYINGRMNNICVAKEYF